MIAEPVLARGPGGHQFSFKNDCGDHFSYKNDCVASPRHWGGQGAPVFFEKWQQGQAQPRVQEGQGPSQSPQSHNFPLKMIVEAGIQEHQSLFKRIRECPAMGAGGQSQAHPSVRRTLDFKPNLY